MGPAYLDNNATTPLHPAVLAALEPYLRDGAGNPSSTHASGVRAARAVADAREQAAALLGCAADEVVFTGGGSEADNLALKGVAWAHRARGRHVVVGATEHPAVSETASFLGGEGWEIDVVPVDAAGRVTPEALAASLRDDTVIASVMHANNETGTLSDLPALAAVCQERGVLFHSDAAQSVGKVPVNVAAAGIDLLTVAGHKFHAPKGVGALYVRRGVRLEPLIHGAGHEGGRRAGTENVVWLVALGAACELARQSGLAAFDTRVRRLRDRLHRRLAEAVPDLVLNGHPVERLPNTLNVSVPGLLGRAVLERCPEVAASTGSACHAGEESPSSVLVAMGVPPRVALGALRLSLGLLTTEADVDGASEAMLRAIAESRDH